MRYGDISHWGEKTTTDGEEKVYIRKFKEYKGLGDRKNPKHTFPFFSREGKVFIVPIYPKYHTELFPDSILNTESPSDFVKDKPHRNAIKKVYISRSFERNLEAGDIIVFYRTGGLHKSVVTTIGIVESVAKPSTIEELKCLTQRRTPLTDEELRNYWSKNYTFVVNFLYAHSFPNRPNMAKLIKLGILKGVEDAPRGFRKISWESFYKISKEAYKK